MQLTVDQGIGDGAQVVKDQSRPEESFLITR